MYLRFYKYLVIILAGVLVSSALRLIIYGYDVIDYYVLCFSGGWLSGNVTRWNVERRRRKRSI